MKNSKTNKNFNVDYECVVEEVSQLKIKVKAIDCVTDSANINNKKMIIDFMKDRWVNKSDAELIMNISQERNNKLDKILN